jgi:myo-inositol 2-dehydrogenase / D-chiro-inositol 1-dehydrogenase
VTVAPERLRLAVIGAGSIVPTHLRAFERLGRTRLVAIASRTAERAAAIVEGFGGVAFTDPARMLDETAPHAVLLAVPPYRTPELCRLLVERRLPFLVEKPLAALDAGAPSEIADAVDASGLVVAVGYHLRGLEPLDDVRRRLAGRRIALVTGRWLDETVAGDWWGSVSRSGGQIVEQATHLFDLARVLAGEATVAGAVSLEGPGTRGVTGTVDVAAATAAVLRFDSGAVGSFAATRVLASARIALEVAAEGLLVTVARHAESDVSGWQVTLDDGGGERELPVARSPYEVQDEAFLDAVVAGAPTAVLCTYRDALATDRLVRAVVGATGSPG